MIEIKSFGSGSGGNCALVKNEKTKLLLDCGFPINKIIKDLGKGKILITDINGVLQTHAHADHSMAVNHLIDYEVPIYCSQQTIDKFNLNATSLKGLRRLIINTIDIIPFEVQHGDCECYGFILHDKDSLILFATDFLIMSQDLSAFPFTEIYIETNYLESKMEQCLNNPQTSDTQRLKHSRQINTHTSLENSVKYLKTLDLSKCKKIVGIHLSKELANINKIKDYIYTNFNIPTYCLNAKGELV